MLKILQINYRLNSAISDFLRESAPIAETLAAVPGLRWKIWLSNEKSREGGGIYLFETEAAMKDFIDGPIVEKLKTNPAVAEVSFKEFDSSPELSKLTRAPI
jgi:hypothetical protein